jgi:hypothetical protein
MLKLTMDGGQRSSPNSIIFPFVPTGHKVWTLLLRLQGIELKSSSLLLVTVLVDALRFTFSVNKIPSNLFTNVTINHFI